MSWVNRGHKSLRGDERLGRPNTATTDENIAKNHQMVLDDHRINETHNRSILRIISCQAEGLEKRPIAEKENPVSSRQRTLLTSPRLR
ncbi:hypothetical protein TNCV_2366481 [Trichonephila clavipes]|nr:hypothetical protein TNCV_2366481 [Trichonephila clavipes]